MLYWKVFWARQVLRTNFNVPNMISWLPIGTSPHGPRNRIVIVQNIWIGQEHIFISKFSVYRFSIHYLAILFKRNPFWCHRGKNIKNKTGTLVFWAHFLFFIYLRNTGHELRELLGLLLLWGVAVCWFFSFSTVYFGFTNYIQGGILDPQLLSRFLDFGSMNSLRDGIPLKSPFNFSSCLHSLPPVAS